MILWAARRAEGSLEEFVQKVMNFAERLPQALKRKGVWATWRHD